MNDGKSSFDEMARAVVDSVEDFAEVEPGTLNDEGHLVIAWGITGFGFGQLSFQTREGVLCLDNETMSRKRCKAILDRMFESCAPADECPPLLCRFKSSDALLDACVPLHGGGDWEPSP